MFDEFFGDFELFEEATKDEVKRFISRKETAWIAMSNYYFEPAEHAFLSSRDVDHETYIEIIMKSYEIY